MEEEKSNLNGDSDGTSANEQMDLENIYPTIGKKRLDKEKHKVEDKEYVSDSVLNAVISSDEEKGKEYKGTQIAVKKKSERNKRNKGKKTNKKK